MPTDFSPTARRALDVARELALAAGPCEIVLAHAHHLPREVEALEVAGATRIIAQLEKTANDRLDELAADLWGEGVSARQVHAQGQPADVIVRLAEQERADLIAIGTHGRSAVSRFFLGSVAAEVLRRATCPVMTIPPD